MLISSLNIDELASGCFLCVTIFLIGAYKLMYKYSLSSRFTNFYNHKTPLKLLYGGFEIYKEMSSWIKVDSKIKV